MAGVTITYSDGNFLEASVANKDGATLKLVNDFKDKYSDINNMLDGRLIRYNEERSTIEVMCFEGIEEFSTGDQGVGGAAIRFLSGVIETEFGEDGELSLGDKPFAAEFYKDLSSLLEDDKLYFYSSFQANVDGDEGYYTCNYTLLAKGGLRIETMYYEDADWNEEEDW